MSKTRVRNVFGMVVLCLAVASSSAVADANLEPGLPVDRLLGLGPAEALRFMPDRSSILFSFRVDGLTASSAADDLRKQSGLLRLVLREMENETGLRVSEMESAYIAGSIGGSLPVSIVTMHQPMEADQLLLKHHESSELVREKIGPYTIIAVNEPEDMEEFTAAVCQVSPRTIVMGSVKQLRESLRRGRPAQISPTFLSALQKADYGRMMTATFDLASLSSEERESLQDAFGLDERLIKAFQSVTFQADLAEKSQVCARLSCRTEAEADDFRKFINLSLGLLKQTGTIPQELAPLASKTRFQACGSEVIATLEMTTAELRSWIGANDPVGDFDSEEIADQ